MTPTQYFSKRTAILTRCKGKKVLHLGCVGHNDSDLEGRMKASPSSLHVELSEIAEVTGIDISADAIEELRKLDICTNILAGNVEELDVLNLKAEYDVIVIGDLIEHLSNPGRMLDGVRKLCTAETEVILTTPHAFGLAPFLRHLTGTFREGLQHVMTFNLDNLGHLIQRHGFRITEAGTCYQAETNTSSLKFKIGSKLFEWFPKFGGTLHVVMKIEE